MCSKDSEEGNVHVGSGLDKFLKTPPCRMQHPAKCVVDANEMPGELTGLRYMGSSKDNVKAE